MFFKKKKPKKYFQLRKDSNGVYGIFSVSEDQKNDILVTDDYFKATSTLNILNRLQELKESNKDLHIKVNSIDQIIDPKLNGGADITIRPYMYSELISTIKNELEDPDTFYAVQGNYPNIIVSKYTKECEDKFSYCLRQKEGNLSLLPKTICFNKKEDALQYQNELIQKAVSELNKEKASKNASGKK